MPALRCLLSPALLLLAACASPGRRPTGPVMPPRPGSMAVVDAATFELGTDSAEIPDLRARYGAADGNVFLSETPRRRERLARYVIDRFEVSNREFGSFLQRNPQWGPARIPDRYHNGRYLEHWAGGIYPTGKADHPVTFVPWQAARAYCQAAGKRLPTEAEWEYAARGGRRGEVFPWGEELPDSARANWSGAGVGGTAPVGTRAPNEYGLYDMAGNVREFTSDEWSGAPAEQMPYAVRGGGWKSAAVALRVRHREGHPAAAAEEDLGFRCAGSDDGRRRLSGGRF